MFFTLIFNWSVFVKLIFVFVSSLNKTQEKNTGEVREICQSENVGSRVLHRCQTLDQEYQFSKILHNLPGLCILGYQHVQSSCHYEKWHPRLVCNKTLRNMCTPPKLYTTQLKISTTKKNILWCINYFTLVLSETKQCEETTSTWEDNSQKIVNWRMRHKHRKFFETLWNSILIDKEIIT